MNNRPDLFSTQIADGGSESGGGLAFVSSGPGFYESGYKRPETIRSFGAIRRNSDEIPALIPVPQPDLQTRFEF